MRISDWSSDVCSSDLSTLAQIYKVKDAEGRYRGGPAYYIEKAMGLKWYAMAFAVATIAAAGFLMPGVQANAIADSAANVCAGSRSEEHTSELQSLMRISYAVFCLKKKKI